MGIKSRFWLDAAPLVLLAEHELRGWLTGHT